MTNEQRAVLAHVVVDPDAWLAHAVSVHGDALAADFLAAKVARWQSEYNAAVIAEGASYKTRAQREAQP